MNSAAANAGWERGVERWIEAHASLIAGLVLAAGFLLRLKAASGTFFNPDEALHFLAGNQTSFLAAYQASLDTAHPPLLLLVLHFWRHLGTSELVSRLPSIIAGTIFCWVLFAWLTERLGRTAGWIGLIFAAFLSPLIELSAEVRQYALLLCFLIIAAYFLERALATPSAARMVLCVLFLYLAMLTHFSAILFAGALGGYSLLRLVSCRSSWRVIAVWAAGMAGAIGLFLFLYRTHISQLKGSDVARRAMEQFLPRSYFHWGHDHLLLFCFARTFGICQWVFGQLAIGDVAGLAFLAGAIILLKSKPSQEPRNREWRALGIFLLLPFAINCVAAIADLYPYGGTRHSSFLAPFVLAGVSFSLAKLVGGRAARAILAALVIVTTCHLFGVPHRPYMLRSDQSTANMARAIGSVRKQVLPAEPIFVDFQTYFMIRYYLCPEIGTAWDDSVPGFRSFLCSGYKVISTEPDTNIFSAATFLPQWNPMVRAYDLKPGQTVWIFQAGWDIGLARDLQSSFAEFRGLEAESFGRNINLFKLTVGQPLPQLPPD